MMRKYNANTYNKNITNVTYKQTIQLIYIIDTFIIKYAIPNLYEP